MGAAVLLNLAFLSGGFGGVSWAWPLGFVLSVTFLAWLQLRMARTWRASTAEMRHMPVTAGTDTAL